MTTIGRILELGGCTAPNVRDKPYPASRFHVEIDGIPMADLAEVAGLSVEVEVLGYRSGADPRALRKPPGLARFGDVTLLRGTTGRADLFLWMKAQVDGRVDRRNVAIALLAEDGGEAMRWKLLRAFPRRLAIGPLVAGSSAILIEERVLAIEGLELSDRAAALPCPELRRSPGATASGSNGAAPLRHRLAPIGSRSAGPHCESLLLFFNAMVRKG